jgi:hypothetical protein
LSSWGKGREAAKREERKAVPFYQQALEEIERLKDPREKACLLGGLAVDWAGIDEKKAREVAEKIGAGEFAEPYSYALLQIAAQYRKWSRKEAEAQFARTLSAAEKIGDPSLRAQRLIQTAREWKTINAGKGKEVLSRALGEARKISGPQEPILLQVLLTQAGWEPDDTVSTAKSGSSPAMQARILLEGAKVLKAQAIDEKIKTLEKALLLAQREKNFRLMAEVAVSWFALVPQRGLEIQRQIEPRDLRVTTLRRMAQSAAVSPLKEEGRGLLDQASEEASKAEGTTEKLQLLREIAADWAAIDKERAKAIYLKAYQIAEKEFLSAPKLRD